MPVVEPYPISEPFATAGKVNMNYQIAPFNYITRKTGLYAVMNAEKIPALDSNQDDHRPSAAQGGPALSGTLPNPGQNQWFSTFYKIMGTYTNANTGAAGGGLSVSVRRNIDIDNTLRFFDDRFNNNLPFVSASEICTMPLVPADMTDPYGYTAYWNAGITTGDSISAMETKLAAFWNANAGSSPSSGVAPIDHKDPAASPTSTSTGAFPGHYLTGDNMLERPYAHLYPKLTTKSNTYTVHVRVQALKKATNTPIAMFKDGQDQVIG